MPEGETVEVGTRLAVVGDADGAPAAAAEPAPAAAPEPRTGAAPRPSPRRAGRRGAGPGARAGTGTGARARAGRRRARAGPAADLVQLRARARPRRHPRPRRHRRRAAADDAGGTSLTSPIVRRLVAEHGLDSRTIQGTGEGGRITRNDVLDAAHRTPSAPAAPHPHRRAGRRRPLRPHRRRLRPAQPRRTRACARTGTGSGTRPASRGARAATRSIPFDNIRRRTAEHMVRSKATSAHVYTSVEVDFERVERVRAAHQRRVEGDGGLLAHLPAVHRARVLRHRARLPARERERRRRRARRAPRRPPRRSRSTSTSRVSSRRSSATPTASACASSRARSATSPSGPAPRSSGPTRSSAARSRSRTRARSAPTLTLPIINQPQVAILATDGIKKRPVVVTDPTATTPSPSTTPACSCSRGTTARSTARTPPRSSAACATCSRSTTGKTSSTDERCCGRAGSVGCPYGEAEALQRALHERADRRLPAAARAPARLHARHHAPIPRTCSCSRRRSAPSSCTPTAAATSPTTGPGSSSATRSSRSPEWRDGLRDVVAYVRRLEDVLIGALADFGIEAHREPKLHRRVGRRREDRRDRREGRARAHPPRLRAQRRSRPRDVRPHRAVRHPRPWRHVDGRAARRGARDARGRRRGGGAVRRARSVRRRSSARTSCGASTPTTSARSRARRWPVATRPDRRRPESTGAPVRLLGRLAEAGVQESVDGPGTRRPEWMRVQGRLRRRTSARPSASCSSSTSTPCARRPAARTSTSAGPTAPPRS